MENNEPLLDRETALQHVQGDEEFLEEIYGIFLEEIPGRKDNFEKALEQDDIESIVGLAHSLKGVSLTIGALSCHKMARKLEMAARNKEQTTVKELYPKLEQIIDQLEKRLSDRYSL